MRTDFEDIYSHKLFNDKLHKIHLLGFMYTPVEKGSVSDIYLRSHGEYYIIKITSRYGFYTSVVSTMSTFDDFIYAKLHTHVIETNDKKTKVNFRKLKYYIPEKPIIIDNISIKKTNDIKSITTTMFQIIEAKKGDSKYVANTTFLKEVERDDFIKNIFPNETGDDILRAWESNDKFQYETYEKLKKSCETDD